MGKRMSGCEVVIVGQGLAGTLLSYHLYKNKINHLVIDEWQEETSSKVAAGLINPIGIKRMVKSWNVDLFLPYAISVYKELEDLLGKRFFYDMTMDKIYGDQDADFWRLRLEKGQLQSYVQLYDGKRKLSPLIKAPYGFGCIMRGGRLNMALMINAYRQFLKEKHLLVETSFKDEELEISKGFVKWKDIQAKKIIFCRGEKDQASYFFKGLDFRNTKGELLNAKVEGLNLQNILLKGIFVLPVGSNEFKIGATFEHRWDDLEPSAEKRNELLDKWAIISDQDVSITKQLTGIRPTMHDRRPVLGFMPPQPEIGIFNGLGSRGGLLAPYFAGELKSMIQDHSYTTFKEVGVERYYKY